MPNETDLYSDGPAESPVDAALEADAENTAEEGGESGSETESTGLLPKDFFEGKPLEVGARCEVEIKRVLDNQIQVRLIPHQYDEESEKSPNDPEMAELME